MMVPNYRKDTFGKMHQELAYVNCIHILKVADTVEEIQYNFKINYNILKHKLCQSNLHENTVKGNHLGLLKS